MPWQARTVPPLPRFPLDSCAVQMTFQVSQIFLCAHDARPGGWGRGGVSCFRTVDSGCWYLNSERTPASGPGRDLCSAYLTLLPGESPKSSTIRQNSSFCLKQSHCRRDTTQGYNLPLLSSDVRGDRGSIGMGHRRPLRSSVRTRAPAGPAKVVGCQRVSGEKGQAQDCKLL